MTSEIVSVETIYEGWGRYLALRVRLPNGEVVRREIEDHGRAAAVLAYDPERRTAILVRQFRAPVFYSSRQEHTLEVIAGLEEDADTATTARREAMEEAGLRLGALEHIATAWAMPGISTEQMTLYLATYGAGDRIHEGGGVATEHENILVEEISLAQLGKLIATGEVADMKTLVLVQALICSHEAVACGPSRDRSLGSSPVLHRSNAVLAAAAEIIWKSFTKYSTNF
jgi:nudix-type nucleoside diphosphatase (YffH/AdpP family)